MPGAQDKIMEKIRVFLSDTQVLFREGIHFTLSGEDDFEVTGESTNNEEAYVAIEANPPNIAILSMKNDKLDGSAVTRRIKRNLPSVSIILVSDSEDAEQLFAAMKSGAAACITKDTDPNYLLDMLRVIAQGSQPIIDCLLTPEQASRTLAEFQDMVTLGEQLDNMLARLSPKEAEILSCIAEGNSLEQAITKLNTNEGHIRRQLRSIANKLVANDQAQALIQVTQQGMPYMMPGRIPNGKLAEYVTKEEFNEFKDHLMERLKSFIGELV
ncbi:response regulator [Chloroflexota bacterium]